MAYDPSDPYQYIEGFDVQNYPCKSGETKDACNKRQFEQRGLAACKICAAIYTAGLATPLCDVLNPIVSKLVWPLVSWIEEPVQDVIDSMVNLAKSITAQPEFDPGYESWKMWIGGADTNSEDQGPVGIYWRKAVSAVEMAWSQMRENAGLPAAPVKIKSETLLKAAKAIWTKPTRGLPKTSAGEHTLGGDLGAVVGAVVDTPEWLGAEDALALFCYQDKTPYSGWGVQVYTLGFFNSKTGWVISEANNGGPVLGFYQGTGPFAISRYLYWDTVCQDNCLAQFRGAVANLWGQRLQSVRRALPGLLAAMSAQIEQEKQAKGKGYLVSASGKLEGPIGKVGLPGQQGHPVSVAAIATAMVATVAAGAGAGYVAVKLIKLLFGR